MRGEGGGEGGRKGEGERKRREREEKERIGRKGGQLSQTNAFVCLTMCPSINLVISHTQCKHFQAISQMAVPNPNTH